MVPCTRRMEMWLLFKSAVQVFLMLKGEGLEMRYRVSIQLLANFMQ